MAADWLQDLLQQVRRNPPHPGVTIRHDCLGELALTNDEAASLLDCDPATLQAVLDGEAGVSPELAAKLERAGWSTAAMWLRLQAHYDLAAARGRLAAAGP